MFKGLSRSKTMLRFVDISLMTSQVVMSLPFRRPKLKNTLFALYRPYIFGLGRSVGKMFYFFSKHYPSKRLIWQNNLFVHVYNVYKLCLFFFDIPLFQRVPLTSKYIECTYM